MKIGTRAPACRYATICPWAGGEVDYLALLHRLEEMDFDGAVILENNSKAGVEESLGRVRTFL